MFILLLDGLDSFQNIPNWLKEEFLEALPANVKVYSAGRLPLQGWQSEYGWETIVTNMPIHPFDTAELTQYATATGITDIRLLMQVELISQGIPLAVSLTCNWIIMNDIKEPLNEANSRWMMQTLEQVFVSEKKLAGINKTLLTLASLTYTFDQELLEHMYRQPISAAEFLRLCRSPFVEARENGGWMVKSGIRKWARVSIKERLPDSFEQYLRRATELLNRRMAKLTHNEQTKMMDYAIGRIFLLENEYVHIPVCRTSELLAYSGPKIRRKYWNF